MAWRNGMRKSFAFSFFLFFLCHSDERFVIKLNAFGKNASIYMHTHFFLTFFSSSIFSISDVKWFLSFTEKRICCYTFKLWMPFCKSKYELKYLHIFLGYQEIFQLSEITEEFALGMFLIQCSCHLSFFKTSRSSKGSSRKSNLWSTKRYKTETATN